MKKNKTRVEIPRPVVEYIARATNHVYAPLIPLGHDTDLVITSRRVIEATIEKQIRRRDQHWERFVQFNNHRHALVRLIERALQAALIETNAGRLATFMQGMSGTIGGLWTELYIESEAFPHIHQHWNNEGVPGDILQLIRAIKAAAGGDGGLQLEALANDSARAVIYEIQNADPDTPPQVGKALEHQTKLLAPWCIEYREQHKCTWRAAGLAYLDYLNSLGRLTDTQTKLARSIELYEQQGTLGEWISHTISRWKGKMSF